MIPRKPSRHPPVRHARRAERGTALIIALLMMLLVSLLGVSMIRSVGVEARMVGNASEKQHAFQTAQSALQWGEWWLAQPGNATTGGTCTNNTNQQNPVICSNPPTSASSFTTVPWVGIPWYTYAPPAVNGVASLATSTAGGLNNYYASPQLYISYLGSAGTGGSQIYQVTAMGYGGNINSVAVVQSTFQVGCQVRDLGNGGC